MKIPANDFCQKDERPDILKGAGAIAEHLFGAAGRRRQVYYLVERMQLPVFRIGQIIYARRSTLAAWITSQEARTAPASDGCKARRRHTDISSHAFEQRVNH